MIHFLQQLYKQLVFYCKAANSKGHGMHSPFVYEFITEVLNDDRQYYVFETIESIKQELLKDNRMVDCNGTNTTVSAFAQSLLPAKYHQLLFRMVEFYKPSTILEIGSSLGIVASYLAAPNAANKVVNITGNPLLALISKQVISEAGIRNADILCQNRFSLDANREKLTNADFVLVHLNMDTVAFDYTELIQLKEASTSTILVLTNIHANKNNEKVWEQVINIATGTYAVELFNIGFLFFRKEQLLKQHFAVRF
ncbi:hypothetical protein [Parasediminibacterium sp. JCM 36343]|uniref:hypothetical protein n=1 Tax=Parasediminibacterium sp. JCM 36343 TaxID=3374279 RepID=UPI0039781E5B